MTAYRQHGVSVAQVVARKQVRMHLRKIREREYAKLRSLIPAVATKKKTTKVQVVEEAVRYIEELHMALMARFKAKHGDLAEDKAQETVQTFVNRMVGHSSHASSSNSASSRPARSAHADASIPVRHASSGSFERHQDYPTFLLRKSRTN